MIQKEQREVKIYQTNFHRHVIQQEEQKQVYYPSFPYRLDTGVHWAMLTFSGVHWLLVFNLRPMTDLLQQTFLEQFRSCKCLQMCQFCIWKKSKIKQVILVRGHWRSSGKRETSRTNLSDNALLTKGTDIFAPCMSEIISTYNICKSSATSIRLGNMEKQAHTNGHMKEFWRCSSLHRR